MSWADLLDRSRSGEAPALAELLRELTPYLLRAARSALGANSVEAEDCLQDILVAVTLALPSFREECSIVHFAIRIAMRSARLAHRRWREGRAREEQAAQLEEPLALTPVPPEESALRAERSAALRLLLEQLPGPQAETIRLRILDGRSMSEVARATGANVNTVRSRLRLARAALRLRINDDRKLSELLAAPRRAIA